LRNSKLPRALAITGVVVGMTLMLVWWYVNTYDPFNLPTVEQVNKSPESYSTPWAYHALETITTFLCPASATNALAIHVPAAVSLGIWIVAALINAPIYYGVGLVIEAISRMAHGRLTHPSTPPKRTP
jgi:hypothetical protein